MVSLSFDAGLFAGSVRKPYHSARPRAISIR